ncbi:hypothetical protein AM499_05600 [Bacillus sp. FJAT-22090]|uniref:hypothetical protein n=1 Tax=Bacillus sp. FJAT-22090 TaxID=1581038 RepID=UPI0006AF1129|nr:hypothetical protein [Bacillus sp. FJAT-22090]ALC85344.1 hypothetical protein AM499_05600 [Bacillus sp. FJAT-22090]
MTKNKKILVSLVFCCLVILVLAGCEKTLIYEGRKSDWKVVYTISHDEKKIRRQVVEIQSVGGEPKSDVTFKAEFPSSSCENNFTLDNKRYKQIFPGCLDVPRPDNKDDSFRVFITWGGQEEKIDLERK